VNYEARTERVPDREKAKGKIKNYKLKHSRLLTCYSALLYLLAIYALADTVTPSDALDMIRRTPTQRLEWLRRKRGFQKASGVISRLIQQYEVFLEATDASEDALIERFLDKAQSQKYMREAFKFGDLMFDALAQIGRNTNFYRLLVV
jgi:hypothetical protein